MSVQSHKLVLYTPHEAQLRFHSSPKRFRVCAWGRQSGKSTGALNDILKRAWEIPNSTIWFISPTYDQAKVQYRRLVGMLWPINEIMLKKNQTELRVKLINNSEIVFKSGQNFEALRGSTLNGCVIDEVREQDPKLWPMVISPMLSTTQGWAAFISTPNGYDSFYDLAKIAQTDTTGDWDFMKAPSNCNPLITESEINTMKLNMSEKQFQQEVLAEFVDLTSGKAYYAFTTDNLRKQNPFSNQGEEWSKHLPIAVAMDFNVNPMCWTLGQNKVNQFYWGDEITITQSNTVEASEALVRRVQNHKAGVIIIGDSSGKARSSKSAGQTDYDIIADAMRRNSIPFDIKTPEINPAVRDRVNIVNLALRSTTGEVNMWVHPDKCPTLVKDFERVTLKESSQGIFALDKTRDPTITHASDGIGYYVHQIVGKQFDIRPSSLKVIVR